MGFIPQANPNGPYWDENGNGNNYYSIVPIENGKPKFIRDGEWLSVYNTLGELGYLISDAGHSS